ncbi:transcriptional regulator WhiB [Mycolicibacterium anyangense]|uniref:Transcriptional regulator WhiB n=1 Tax=Mycolicibacterium anyangense TaxID=1431246 RepID=A0A6N4W2M0_9MYCO|nr:WhiB family transcriptional regulator [Mycolicibacterium anyangense]BBZ75239.1 transcriptional regulator WhiB [Mycolicibacterium anyangense]
MRRQRFPRPSADEWDWQRRGVCRAADSSVFFGPDHEPRAARIRREQIAKNLCHGCPVLAKCRSHALNACEPYGIWGGLSASERAQLSRPARRDVDSSCSIAL